MFYSGWSRGDSPFCTCSHLHRDHGSPKMVAVPSQTQSRLHSSSFGEVSSRSRDRAMSFSFIRVQHPDSQLLISWRSRLSNPYLPPKHSPECHSYNCTWTWNLYIAISVALRVQAWALAALTIKRSSDYSNPPLGS